MLEEFKFYYWWLLAFLPRLELHDCRSCHALLPKEAFNPSRLRKYDYICKKCQNELNAKWRIKNPEYKREYQQAHAEEIRNYNKEFYRKKYGKGYWDKPRPFLGNQYKKLASS